MTTSPQVTLTLYIVHETRDAILVSDLSEDDEQGVWLPRSQLDLHTVSDSDAQLEITMPEWLARDKELI